MWPCAPCWLCHMCGLAWLSLRCGGRTGPAPPERCAPDAQDQLLVVCRRSSCTRSSCATPSAPRTTSPRVATASPRSNGSSSRQPARPSPLPTPRSTSQASLAPTTSRRRPLWPMPASWRLSTSSRRERVASLARRGPAGHTTCGWLASWPFRQGFTGAGLGSPGDVSSPVVVHRCSS